MKDADKLLKIIGTFGLNNQKRKFAEESFEFIEAVTEYECDIRWEDYDRREVACDKGAITEELADCMVLLRQFVCFFQIPEEEVEKMIEFKINRTLERMNNGKEKDNTKRMG
jgi:MazG nucleotide pyrophosphohydrolase domain.